MGAYQNINHWAMSTISLHFAFFDKIAMQLSGWIPGKKGLASPIVKWLTPQLENMVLKLSGLLNYIDRMEPDHARNIHAMILLVQKHMRIAKKNIEVEKLNHTSLPSYILDFHERIFEVNQVLDELDARLLYKSLAPLDRKHIMTLSPEDRDKILWVQSLEMTAHYESDETWKELGVGEFVEYD